MKNKIAFEFVLASNGQWGVFALNEGALCDRYNFPDRTDLTKTGSTEVMSEFVRGELERIEKETAPTAHSRVQGFDKKISRKKTKSNK